MSSTDASAKDYPLGNPEARAKLREHFDVPVEKHGAGWEQLWERGTFLPWDRGFPNPALVDAMKERKQLFGTPLVGGKRKTALVPGCGKGYDVLFLTSLGYDVYGLDISSNAIAACDKFAEENFKSYEVNADTDAGSGQYNFVVGDFFKDDWLGPDVAQNGFDIIYDYTFLCALHPSMRPAWSLRMSQLLAKEGRLICLEFPTHIDPSTGGPPFGLSPDTYLAHLGNPGVKIPYTDKGYPENKWAQETAGPNLQRIEHWMPQRTHEIGKGTDWMSIWGHA